MSKNGGPERVKEFGRISVATMASLALVMPATAWMPTLAQAGSPQIPAAVGQLPLPSQAACREPLQKLDLFRETSGFAFPGTLRILDETRPINLDTFQIGVQPYDDPSRKLWYESLLWLAWSAAVAKDQGRTADVEKAKAAALRVLSESRDPGTATPAAKAYSNALGWSGGSAFRRLEALNCLAAVVGTAPLVPYLNSHAKVLLDENRYFGPPQRSVKNLGMLSNLLLLDVGKRLDNATYRYIAIQRLLNERKQVFSDAGATYEGSNHYHTVLVMGWLDVAKEFDKRGYGSAANQIRQAVGKGFDVAAHLVSPTGVPLLLGNSRPEDGYIKPAASNRSLTLLDLQAGMAAGRWSWQDRNTTAWTAQNRLKTGSHGHRDAGSITWQTDQLPILTPVGQPDYQNSNPFTQWSESAQGQNLSKPNEEGRDRQRIRTLSLKREGQTDRLRITTTARRKLQTREAVFDNVRKTLLVSDHVGIDQVQYWHLSPEWVVSASTANSLTLENAAGRTLLMQVSEGTTITYYRGSWNPIAGWQTTGFEKLTPATQIEVAGGRSIDTRFVLDPAPTTRKAFPARPTWEEDLAPANKAVKLNLASGQKGLQGYLVQYAVGGGPWQTAKINTASDKSQIRVRKLQNGTRYRFRVAATTKLGVSEFSKVQTFTPATKPDRVTEPAVKKTAKKIALTWQPPVSDGGAAVSGYVAKTHGVKEWKSLRNAKLRWRATGAKKYEFKIRAVNAAGEGRSLKLTVKHKTSSDKVKVL